MAKSRTIPTDYVLHRETDPLNGPSLVRVAKFACQYGCDRVEVSGELQHAWDCQYWQREGLTKTPF